MRNEPVYDEKTLEWLRQFEGLGLSGDQKRLLAYAHAHADRFTSRDYQKLIGLDIYAASNSIKELIRKGLVQSTGTRSRIYKVVQAAAGPSEVPDELINVMGKLAGGAALTNRHVRDALGVSRLTAARYLSRWVESGWLRPVKRGRGSRYRSTEKLNVSLSKCINDQRD